CRAAEIVQSLRPPYVPPLPLRGAIRRCRLVAHRGPDISKYLLRCVRSQQRQALPEEVKPDFLEDVGCVDLRANLLEKAAGGQPQQTRFPGLDDPGNCSGVVLACSLKQLRGYGSSEHERSSASNSYLEGRPQDGQSGRAE